MTPITKHPMTAPRKTGAGEDFSGLDSRKRKRRLALLRRAGLFRTEGLAVEVTRACTLSDLLEAYRLVYHTFLANGYMEPNGHSIRVRIFEATDDTATFIAKADEEVVGVQSLALDSPDLGLPSDVAFREELDAMRKPGIRLCEATNEAISPAFRKTAVVTELMRCASAQSFLRKCDLAVTTVSPSHAGFYDLLGFRQIGPVRSYSKDIDDPVVLMWIDLKLLQQKDPTLNEYDHFGRDFLTFTNSYIGKVEAWERQARRCFRDPGLLRKLFLDESGLLETCTKAQRQAIRSRWGDALFAQAVGDAKPQSKHWAHRYVPVRPPRGSDKHQQRKGLSVPRKGMPPRPTEQ